jgi:hypothetical protein
MKYNQDVAITRRAVRQFLDLRLFDPPLPGDEEDLEKLAEMELKRVWAQASYIEDNCDTSNYPVIHFRGSLNNEPIDFFVRGKHLVAIKQPRQQ